MAVPSNFADWSPEDAKAVIDSAIAAQVTRAGYTANEKFVELQDHWQAGAAWVGPNGGTDPTVRTNTLTSVERQFTPVDVIGEVLDRAVNGVAKREADYSFVAISADDGELAEGSAESDAVLERAEAMARSVDAWWDRVNFWDAVRLAIRRSRWASRGGLRLWVPASRLRDESSEQAGTRLVPPSGLTFEDALAMIEVEAPTPDKAYVYTDPDTRAEAGIVLTLDATGDPVYELWYRDGEDTVVKVLGSPEEPVVITGLGRLPIVEMTAPLLITEAVRRQQKRLNFFESMVVRVGEAAGFPERYIMNAKASGIWSTATDPENPIAETTSVDGTTYYLHERPLTLGAGMSNMLVGLTTTDAAGNESLASPSVIKFDPTDPEYAVKACRHARRTVLESCKQKHVALQETGEASGTAYQQARADFEDDLTATKSPAEALLRETLRSLIELAESMTGSATGFLDDYRIVVNLHIQTGPVTPEEAAQNQRLVEAGLLSPETAMARNGVEDVEGELTRIREGALARATLLVKQAEAMRALGDAIPGLDVRQAALAVGLDEDAVKALLLNRGTLELEPVQQ